MGKMDINLLKRMIYVCILSYNIGLNNRIYQVYYYYGV